MSELEHIKEDIKETKAELEKAKQSGDRDMIVTYVTLLAEQQKKENLLLAQSAPGKSRSNRF